MDNIVPQSNGPMLNGLTLVEKVPLHQFDKFVSSHSTNNLVCEKKEINALKKFQVFQQQIPMSSRMCLVQRSFT